MHSKKWSIGAAQGTGDIFEQDKNIAIYTQFPLANDLSIANNHPDQIHEKVVQDGESKREGAGLCGSPGHRARDPSPIRPTHVGQ